MCRGPWLNEELTAGARRWHDDFAVQSILVPEVADLFRYLAWKLELARPSCRRYEVDKNSFVSTDCLACADWPFVGQGCKPRFRFTSHSSRSKKLR